MQLATIHSNKFWPCKIMLIFIVFTMVGILPVSCRNAEDKQKKQTLIELTQKEQKELESLWDQARKLKYNDYEKQVLPKWQKYGDKAVLFALEKLKSSTFPARLHTSDKGDLRDIVWPLIKDVPNRTYKPILQQLRDETVSGPYRGTLMGYLKSHLNFEVCNALVSEFADDKRETRPEIDEDIVKPDRVCDWACYLVIGQLGLQQRFPESDRNYKERDKTIEAFKKWWEENREYAKKKLEEREGTSALQPEEDLK